jgi:hypothetical protein
MMNTYTQRDWLLDVQLQSVREGSLCCASLIVCNRRRFWRVLFAEKIGSESNERTRPHLGFTK